MRGRKSTLSAAPKVLPWMFFSRTSITGHSNTLYILLQSRLLPDFMWYLGHIRGDAMPLTSHGHDQADPNFQPAATGKRCNTLQHAATPRYSWFPRRRHWKELSAWNSESHCVAVCSNVWQCPVMRYSVLQCVAVPLSPFFQHLTVC